MADSRKPPATSPVSPRLVQNAPVRRASPRLLPLLLLGLALVSAALWLRSSSWMREAILRGKDLPELEAIVRDRPDDPIAQYYLAKRYYVSRRFSDARDAYERAVQHAPKWARARLGLALSYYELGNKTRAREEFTETLRLDPRSAWAEYMLGKLAWFDRDLKTALEHVKRATELDPRSEQAWYGLAACYSEMRRHEEAIEALRKAVDRPHANPAHLTALGELLVFRGKVDEARQQYERALQIDPDFGPACALLGSLYLRKIPGPDSLDRAQALLERATKLKTRNPEMVWFDLGQLYVRRKQYPKAVEALQASIRIYPRDERAYYILANAYRRMGRQKEAQETEKRFARISELHIWMQTLEARVGHDPRNWGASLRLARVYKELGLDRQAVQQYMHYLSLRQDDRAVAREFEAYLRLVGDALDRPQPDFVVPAPPE